MSGENRSENKRKNNHDGRLSAMGSIIEVMAVDKTKARGEDALMLAGLKTDKQRQAVAGMMRRGLLTLLENT